MTEAARLAIQALDKVLTDLEVRADDLLQQVVEGRSDYSDVASDLAIRAARVELHRETASRCGYEHQWRALEAALVPTWDGGAAAYLRIVHTRARSTLGALRRSSLYD